MEGITTKGTTFATGANAQGNALSADLLGSSVTSGGVQFNIGQANTLNLLATGGQTLSLPAGQYSQLRFLAIGVQGNQLDQTFTVAYTDGTVATLTQSLSDWFTPQGYPGEAVAAATTYRNTSTGGTDNRTFDVYRYTINLDSTKTVSRSAACPTTFTCGCWPLRSWPPSRRRRNAQVTTGSGVIDLSWTGSTNTAATYNVYRGTTAGGESSVPINATPLPAGTTSFDDTTAVAGNTYYYVIKAIGGAAASPASNEVTAALPASGASTVVDLASYFNLTGITAKGSKFTGGLDGVGYALVRRPGTSTSWNGATFVFGPTGTNDVVRPRASRSPCRQGSTASSTSATGVEGNQASQAFTVHYTDGTSTTVTQSISDWFTPQHYAGESVAVASAYRNTSGGGTDSRTFDVYGYAITLDSSKTVSSITLPSGGHVEVLAVDVVNLGRLLAQVTRSRL